MTRSQAIITVKQLTKTFGAFTAVADLSFSVPKASIYAFLGPNGAGKTTTIKMLTTILSPTSGAITINGYDAVVDALSVRRSFGIVFQDPSSDDELTAEENLRLHADLYGIPSRTVNARIDEVLSLVDLLDRKKAFVRTFSGGMKRRLEIARALMHKPAVIFLDEPTAGLDPQTRNKLWDYIVKLNKEQGVTVLFTTHYMEEAQRVAHEVAIIDHGKILVHGTPAGVMKQTKTKTLEAAFLSLTGKAVRGEEMDPMAFTRQHARVWGR